MPEPKTPNDDVVVDVEAAITAALGVFIYAAKQIENAYSWFVPFRGIIEFILHKNGDKSSIVSQEGQPSHVSFVSPFSILQLFYFRHLMTLQLFCSLCMRRFANNVDDVFLYDEKKLPTNFKFRLCHLCQEKTLIIGKTCNPIYDKEKAKVKDLVVSSFEYLTDQDIESITKSFKQGQVLYIIGFDNTAKAHHVVAAVMYVMSPKGSFINWLAVTTSNYDKIRFGKFASDKSFRHLGLATFLLYIIQLQAASQAWSTDLYLQTNIATDAYKWYLNHGFVMTEANHPEILPIEMQMYIDELAKLSLNDPNVHFVTTESWMDDVIAED